jgi:hypothetical protein
MHFRQFLLFALLLASASVAVAKERVWTSNDGRTMRGEFVRELDGEVTFLVGGKLQTVPLSRLSERDQQIVRDLAAGREVPDDSLPASADDPFTGPPAESKPPAASGSPAAVGPAEATPADRPPPLVSKPKTAVNRVWTDNQGRKTTGKFVRVFNGDVVLLRAGGPISIPFYDLAEADQEYVKDLLKSWGQEELIPDRPAPSDPAEREFGSTPAPGQSPAPGRGLPGPMRPPMPGPGGLGSGPPGAGVPGNPAGGYDPSNSSGYGTGGYDPSGYGPPVGLGPTSGLGTNTDRSIPSYSEPPVPATDPATAGPRRLPVCSSCRARLSETEAQGTHCPHCGAAWSFNLYNGNSTSATTSSTTTSRTGLGRDVSLWNEYAPDTIRAIWGGILVVVVLVVLTAIVVGLVSFATAVATATRSGRQYRDM